MKSPYESLRVTLQKDKPFKALTVVGSTGFYPLPIYFRGEGGRLSPLVTQTLGSLICYSGIFLGLRRHLTRVPPPPPVFLVV